ncbi:MAG: ABC transporter permease [Bacteroidales bacterium]|jgi:putative ABC transport system permease protein
MIDYDKWQEIFHTLKKNKLRTGLTAFGVFWGILMLMIMLGAGSGLENGVYSGMGDFATNSMFIWARATTMPYKGFPRNRWYHFEYDDMIAIKNKVPGIDIITPTVHGGGWQVSSTVVYEDQKGEFRVEGIMPDENRVDPVNIVEGRYLNEFDILNKRKVALLGYRIYEELFKSGEKATDKYIKLNGMYFQVVGVYKSKHTGGWGEEQNSIMFIPFSTTEQVYNYPNIVDHFSIVGKPNYDIVKIEKQVKSILAKRHSIHPEDAGAFGYHNVGEQFKKMRGLFLGIRGLIWIVGIGTLLAGIIGVSNIMLIIIKERTREFGIKRAMGATPFKIISTVISESVFLTSLAGMTGMALGIYVVALVNKALLNADPNEVMFMNPEVEFSIAMKALIILVIAGIFAGMIPAKRAVSIKPIEAIRDEN